MSVFERREQMRTDENNNDLIKNHLNQLNSKSSESFKSMSFLL